MIPMLLWAFAGLLAVGALALLAAVWVWMLADVLRHEPIDGSSKLLWASAVLLTWPWGGAVYFFARRPTRLREYGE